MPEKAIAIQTYSAQDKDELSFIKGEEIEIISKEGERWWFGKLKNGQTGAVPTAFIALENYDKCIVEFSYVDVQPGEIKLHVNDVIEILEKSDDGKWFGKNSEGEEGYFHKAFVKEFPKLPPPVPKELREDNNNKDESGLTIAKTTILHDVRRDRPKKPNAAKRPSRYLADDYDPTNNPGITEDTPEPETQAEVVEEVIKPKPKPIAGMPPSLFADLKQKFALKSIDKQSFKATVETISSFQKTTTNAEHRFPLKPTGRPTSLNFSDRNVLEKLNKPLTPQSRIVSVEKISVSTNNDGSNADKNKEILKMVEGLEQRMLEFCKDLQDLKKDLQQMYKN